MNSRRLEGRQLHGSFLITLIWVATAYNFFKQADPNAPLLSVIVAGTGFANVICFAVTVIGSTIIAVDLSLPRAPVNQYQFFHPLIDLGRGPWHVGYILGVLVQEHLLQRRDVSKPIKTRDAP